MNISVTPLKELKVDKLTVRVFDSRYDMGKASAFEVAEKMKSKLALKEQLNMIFAAAASQTDFLASILEMNEIEWSKVKAFHMDEYHTLPSGASQRFGNFLDKHLFKKVDFKDVFYVGSDDPSSEKIVKRYTELLMKNPVDIVCMGIGENGHIAFNDPPVADFNDPVMVKEVLLDDVCRQQQVNDGEFAKFEDVPEKAMTLTVPTLMSAGHLSIVVPNEAKAQAVYDALNGPISNDCPASILRTHDDAILYLDRASASKIF